MNAENSIKIVPAGSGQAGQDKSEIYLWLAKTIV
jgi:hypothetical protein